jgi:hypothetical protein
MSRLLPDGRRPIERITESYVRHRFGRRPAPAAVLPSTGRAATETVGDVLITSWQNLEPVLWRAWLSKLVGLSQRKRKDHFTLIDPE